MEAGTQGLDFFLVGKGRRPQVKWSFGNAVRIDATLPDSYRSLSASALPAPACALSLLNFIKANSAVQVFSFSTVLQFGLYLGRTTSDITSFQHLNGTLLDGNSYKLS
nr:PREDICTED: uncharacterized protein LOC109039887 [Bemisia tabaci]